MAFYAVNPNTPGLQEKFWPKVKVSSASQCWEWQGPITHKGYGAFSVGRRPIPAHRFAYAAKVGPIADELVLDHICRNRLCVNPAHLRQVTQRENILCGIGPTAINSRKTHCPQGHEYAPPNLTFNSRGERLCVECEARRRERANVKRKAARHAAAIAKSEAEWDRLSDAISGAYIDGATDVHRFLFDDPEANPDFKEAAYDYARQALAKFRSE
jgi:HNH endonuclease